MKKIYLNRETREKKRGRGARQRNVVTFLFQSIQVREKERTPSY